MTLTRRHYLAGAAALLHGPIDVALTTYGRATLPTDPENNPVVLALEPGQWVAIKVGALAAVPLLFLVDEHPLADLVIDALLALLVLLGLVLVVPNAYVIASA